MSFFYDLNKKLDSIRATPEVTHQQLNERDMSRAAKGYEKYGKQGMEALAKAGREGKALDPVRKKYNKYDNEKVSEESGMTKHVIPVGVIDGPGGYDGAQQRIKDYESGNINRDGKKLPPVVDKSRPAKSIDEGPFSLGKKIYNVGKQAADEIGDYYSRNPKTGELNTLPDRDMKPGETFDTAWERMQDERAMRQGKGEIKQGNYGTMRVDPKTGAYVPQPPVYIKADEGLAGAGKKIYDLGKRAASGINKMIGHGSDEEMLDTLRKDMSVTHPTGSKRPTPPGTQSTGKRPPYEPDEDNQIIRPDDPRAIQAKAYFDKQVKEAGAPMTPKQKSFAKLAPPVGKITFADKIAGAKKEVDEMLGDVAAEAMRNALSPKQKKMAALGGDPKRIDARDLAALRKGADMGEERSKGTAFDMSTPRAAKPKVGSVERGHKHDIKHTATGRMVTRRVDDQGNSVGADDDSAASGEKRGRGRPKGTKQSIGAKGPSGRSKLMTREGEVDIRDQGEYDQEGDMAKNDIKTIVRHAQALSRVLGDNDNLPEWVQSKLAKIEGMMISVDEYMQNQEGEDEEEPIAEKAVSKKQQRFMGMVHATQRGEKAPSKEVGKVAKTMKKSDAEDFAKTKHKGLPEKAKKKEVGENSDDGRLITKQTGPGQSLTTSTTGRVSATIDKGKMSVKPGKSTDDDADTASAKDTSSSKSNSMVGKGIYDSMNRELELMIAESMSVNMSDSTEGNKSLTVTATDDDAMKLAMILKSAGLGGHGGDMHSHGEEACDTCGMSDCGCGDVQEAVDENAPDWPTNTEQAKNNFGYSGGLNKPKADVAGNGQSTVPVVATRPHNDDLRRMMEMAGIQNEQNVDLGPPDPETAHMTPDEVNAAFYLGSDGSNADMTPDEVTAALRAGSGPDPDEVYGSGSSNTPQYEDSIRRMREMAGIREAKKEVDEEKTEEGNLFTGNLAKARADGKKEADLDGDGDMEKVRESIFSLTNQWKTYKG